ncbi:hypothetical protein VMCG_05863 [Cytospora schulzeri]|uniref:Uncharacterized protein n=1 Tax=Cytospora schulzeri TaxID=448051 RepID=A0A423WD93_9PEZI|nr:hypothetical protein VMCG_05863 [Valsa malicola]
MARVVPGLWAHASYREVVKPGIVALPSRFLIMAMIRQTPRVDADSHDTPFQVLTDLEGQCYMNRM